MGKATQAELAIVITDWRRPERMGAVLRGVFNQITDAATRVYVLHQENDRKYDGVENIWLETNHCSGGRWLILPLIPEPYVVMIDDDIELTNPLTLASMLEGVKQYRHVGVVGQVLRTEPPFYTGSARIISPETPCPVDVVLGCLNMIETRLAQKLWADNYELAARVREAVGHADKGLYIDHDDILTSWFFKKDTGRENYVIGVPGSQNQLPYEVLRSKRDNDIALASQPDHYPSRNKVAQMMVENLGGGYVAKAGDQKPGDR